MIAYTTRCYCTVSNLGFPFCILSGSLENKIQNGKHNSTFWEEYSNSFQKGAVQVQQKASVWPSYILLLTYSALCCLHFKAIFVWNDLLPHLPTAKALGATVRYGSPNPINDALPALAQRACDATPSVRSCLADVLGEWLLNLPDR